MILRLGGLFITFVLLGAACTSEPIVEEAPAFGEPSPPVAALLGETFDAASFPPVLGGGQVGSQLLTSTEPLRALHWFVQPVVANFVFSTLADRNDAGEPIWRAQSAWELTLEPGMVVTVGTTVCKPAPHSYDWEHSTFVAVTNTAQDQALGAWALTENGPTPYLELDSLDCERFIP